MGTGAGRAGASLTAAGGHLPGAALHVQTFGGFCLYRDGRPEPAASWRRQAAKPLLVRLLLAEGRPVPKSDLYGVLWPEVPEAAAANRLRVTLHALRRVLEPGLPPRLPSAYLIVNRYECALPAHPNLRWDGGVLAEGVAKAASAAQVPAEVAALLRGLAGVAGPWLPEMDNLGTFAAARWRLQELALTAALRLAELALDRGVVAAAETAIERALAIDPGSEQAYALLLRAAGASGRSGRVRRAYAYTCAQLREHVDVEPGPGLRRIAAEALEAARARVARPRPRPAGYPAGGSPSGTARGASIQ